MLECVGALKSPNLETHRRYFVSERKRIYQRFVLFPSRDYCVLTSPTTMNSNVSLLDHFTPVPSRVGSTFSHALFLLHRDALVADRQLTVNRFDPVAHGPQATLLLGRASEHDPREDFDDVSSADAASATAASLAATATATAASNAGLASLAEEADVPLAENPNVAAFVAVLGAQVVAVVAVLKRRVYGGSDLQYST